MSKLTPYDRAVRKAHDRQTRALRYEQNRHTEKLDKIDGQLKRDLIQASLLPGSPGIDPTAVVHLFKELEDGSVRCGVNFHKFVAANQFPPEQVTEIRDAFAARRRYRGGGGAAPIWEIWA